jgi:hypothetical protein
MALAPDNFFSFKKVPSQKGNVLTYFIMSEQIKPYIGCDNWVQGHLVNLPFGLSAIFGVGGALLGERKGEKVRR